MHFGTEASHRLAQASLLSAHIRIPLNWFYSATVAYFPDETANTIRRVYESPAESHTRRQFCGYCGTPLTFWTEQPHGEGDYIHVTLGSLCRDDLGDLDELGLIPESPSSEEGGGGGGGPSELSVRVGGGGGGALEAAQQASKAERVSAALSMAAQPIGRESRGIPWIESLVEGSSLGGRLKRASVTRQSADGSAWAQWHIVEYSDGDGHGQVIESSEPGGSPSGNNGKRKLADRDDGDDRMGATQH